MVKKLCCLGISNPKTSLIIENDEYELKYKRDPKIGSP